MVGSRSMIGKSLLVSAMLALGLAAGARAESPLFDLCIEQNPAKAGKVTPDSGTHRFSANSVVSLSAEPRAGYQFAYWLGDVADPTARHTVVHVTASKVIVAIFRPSGNDPLEKSFCGGGGGGASLTPTLVTFGGSGFTSYGGSKPETPDTPHIPTPEPTTLGFLALGALALRRVRRAQRQT